MLVAEKITTASDLAKNTKRVLDEASRGPVSIPRANNSAITLIDREAWYGAKYAKDWLSTYNSIVRYVVEFALDKKELAYPAEFAWLLLFEDINDLRDFVDELSVATQNAISGLRPWADVEAIVEEWRRSAMVLADEDLQRRFKQTLGDVR